MTDLIQESLRISRELELDLILNERIRDAEIIEGMERELLHEITPRD